MSETERPPEVGNASSGVVRVGETVRKPWRHATPAVIEFTATVRSAGVDLPRVLGRDDQARQILEFVAGRLARDLPPLSDQNLARVGRMVRAIQWFVPTGAAPWESVIAFAGQ